MIVWTFSDTISIWGLVIDVAAILINGFLAVWIVRKVQSVASDQRALKDFFMNEVVELRENYNGFLDELSKGLVSPKIVLNRFKMLNIRTSDVMESINKEYKIDIDLLSPYQLDLRELVTENEDFIARFKKKTVRFSPDSKQKLLKFHTDNAHLFRDLIVLINKG